jgi:hypothetical protein
MAIDSLRPPLNVPRDIREFSRWCREALDGLAVTDDELAAVTAAYIAADAAHVAASDPHTQYTTAAELATALAAVLTTANTWTAKQTFSVPPRTPAYPVAGLPAGVQGDRALVTDATAPTFLAAPTGGGAVVCPVFHNGTAWTVG